MATKPPDKIKIKIDDNPIIEIPRSAYAEAKTKQLREFGYTDLTVETVKREIDAILSGKKLTVIGKFMEDEIVKPK